MIRSNSKLWRSRVEKSEFALVSRTRASSPKLNGEQGVLRILADKGLIEVKGKLCRALDQSAQRKSLVQPFGL